VVGKVAQLRMAVRFRNHRAMNLRRLALFLLGSLASVFFAASLATAEPAPPRVILILGDSLTAGYGLPDPATQAYPALIGEKLAARAAADPASPRWRVINAGVSGDTTSGGLRRIDWVLRQPVAILVLALGSNDGLRGLDPGLIARNLAAIGAKVRAKYPEVRVLLVGQRMPVNMGDYAERFEAVFPAVAQEQSWPLVPFLLKGVGGVRMMNQADGIHPNEDGHSRMAETVWAGLVPLLESNH
jgi:acyl-CoA thioesterase I